MIEPPRRIVLHRVDEVGQDAEPSQRSHRAKVGAMAHRVLECERGERERVVAHHQERCSGHSVLATTSLPRQQRRGFLRRLARVVRPHWIKAARRYAIHAEVACISVAQ